MNVNIPDKPGLSRKPKLEQSMDWLVQHGPIHENPPLPAWILKRLVRTKRIARLRRGLYLAPDRRTGQMPPLPVIAARLAPEGYLSFYGALSMYGLTDQDPSSWGMVTRRRQASLRYGRQRLYFVAWPERLKKAKTKQRSFRGSKIKIATPVQAYGDALEKPRLSPGLPELLHVLLVGLSTKQLTVAGLRAYALRSDSVVVARRLGFLLEIATGRVDPALKNLARRSHDWTPLERAPHKKPVRESRWMLVLPTPKEQIAAAAR
jgi:predicted transcriptional regulator of viral defense system